MTPNTIAAIRAQAKGLYARGEQEAAEALNNLATAYDFLAKEYATVLCQAGFSESIAAGKADALTWIDPTKRPQSA